MWSLRGGLRVAGVARVEGSVQCGKGRRVSFALAFALFVN